MQYDYDLTGAMIAVRENGATTGVGVLAAYSYNDLGQRVSVTRAGGGGASTTYSYADPAKRLSQIVHDLDGAGTANDLTVDFTYSPASQISARTASNDGYSWLGHFNEDVTDLINGLNQPTRIGATAISHDARGNLTSDGTKIFTYDAQNRLVSTADGAALKYDALGRLYEITKAGATTRFLHDGAEVIAEYDSNGAILRRYVRGAGPDEVLVWYEGPALADRRFLLADERGSVIAGADSAGATLFKNVYDEYGKPGSNNQGRFQYTGQMWLAEAGLYHYKARLYDPGLGRFLQTDPIGYAAGMNLYAYVGGDPVNNIDPTGLFARGDSLLFGSCAGRCVDSNGNNVGNFGPGGLAGDLFGGGGGARHRQTTTGGGTGFRQLGGFCSGSNCFVFASRGFGFNFSLQVNFLGNGGGQRVNAVPRDPALPPQPQAPRDQSTPRDPRTPQERARDRLIFQCNVATVVGSVGALAVRFGGIPQVRLAGAVLFVGGFLYASAVCIVATGSPPQIQDQNLG